MLTSIFAISVGASAGAIMRWLLGLSLNAIFPTLPLGTLAANLIGGYLMGVALAIFALYPITLEWRLAIVTGFLGSLTTFSAFSAETTLLLLQGRLMWATAAIGLHVLGSLACTMLGLATVSALR
ncbi:MAG: fluoride efflux transporter CrcB [Burkholderiaceae bacterium]|nr:fluoride efflux transporter CrcB [Burkholderiaceae bacterium]